MEEKPGWSQPRIQEGRALKPQASPYDSFPKVREIKAEGGGAGHQALQPCKPQIGRRQSNQGGGGDSAVPDCRSPAAHQDCAEIYNSGHKQSGFYKMKALKSPREFLAYCNMHDGGGWTVIQRRSDGSQNFSRVWADYKQGFGDFNSANGEYWLGNENLHYLTTQRSYILRIDLADFKGNCRYAQYKSFTVGDEKSSYLMNCGEYSGTAGDSLSGGFHPEETWWASHKGMKFSTFDKDNDNYEGNCAEEDKAGWWFNRCHAANLNGLYYKGPYTAMTDNGVVWYTWHGWWYSLKSVVMKIRPAEFEPNLV
uniref:Fibrinogen-like protein 1 n=1 Tax=Geotrypetes seraphini TaxID=260995 RepID=A0A6P8QS34_GEOSA|nr:fibrinogen-like protein 1 isoform X2 [Geotrypetes seraphini]